MLTGDGIKVLAGNGAGTAEYVERPKAHLYATRRLRRVHLRGQGTIAKNLLVQVCSLILGLLLRQLMGVGTPRGLQDRPFALIDALLLAVRRFWRYASRSPALMPRKWACSLSLRPITPTY